MPFAVGVAPLESVIVAFAPDGTTDVYELAALPSRFTVGRSATNALCLRDPRISSGRHCAFERADDGALVLVSFEHPNAERVNGERVRGTRRLYVGDEVVLGGSRLRFAHRRAALANPPSPSPPPELMAAIIAAPDDAGPRLVLADWLLERGDPRGELIQLQHRLGQRHDASLAERAAALLAAHEADWIAPLSAPVERWAFEDGFVSEVKVLRAATTEAGLAALRAAHPIRRVVDDG